MLTNTKLLGSALALALAAPVMAQQQDFSAVKIETQQLAPGLFMLMGSGGNMALSTGPDGAVLVDTEYAPLNAKILAAVKQAGGGAVKYVVNTHWHGDHTGGNEPLGKAGAQIIAHNNVRVRMSSEQFMAAFNQKIPPSPAAALPTITFPNARDVPLERQHRERHPREPGAHRRRFDRALHERERDSHRRHVREGSVSVHRSQQQRLARRHHRAHPKP